MQLWISTSVMRAFFFWALAKSNLTLDRADHHSMSIPPKFIWFLLSGLCFDFNSISSYYITNQIVTGYTRQTIFITAGTATLPPPRWQCDGAHDPSEAHLPPPADSPTASLLLTGHLPIWKSFCRIFWSIDLKHFGTAWNCLTVHSTVWYCCFLVEEK